MKHVPLNDVSQHADIHNPPVHTMDRREKLLRWAELLQREPQKRLATMDQFEYLPPERRAALRVKDSPLTVAYADPVLRGQGLADDTLGEAMRFFALSHYDTHKLLCSCHNGSTVEAGSLARRLQGVATGPRLLPIAMFAAAGLVAAVSGFALL
jgi:hypothetical protein